MAIVELGINLKIKVIRKMLLFSITSLILGCNSQSPSQPNEVEGNENSSGYIVYYIPYETDFFDATTATLIEARASAQKMITSKEIERMFAQKNDNCNISSDYPFDFRVKISKINQVLYIDSEKKFSDGKMYCKFENELTTKVLEAIEKTFRGSVDWPPSKIEGHPVPVKKK